MGFREGSPALLSHSSRCDIQMGCKAHPADVSTGEGTFQKGSIGEASWKRTPRQALHRRGWVARRERLGEASEGPPPARARARAFSQGQLGPQAVHVAETSVGIGSPRSVRNADSQLHPRRLWFLRADRTQEPAFEQTSGVSPTPGASWSEKLGCKGQGQEEEAAEAGIQPSGAWGRQCCASGDKAVSI